MAASKHVTKLRVNGVSMLENKAYTVFGCRKVCWELNWTSNSISKMERKWAPIQIPPFGCEWNLRSELKGSTRFQFLFGCIKGCLTNTKEDLSFQQKLQLVTYLSHDKVNIKFSPLNIEITCSRLVDLY